jgi:hypothetical protein
MTESYSGAEQQAHDPAQPDEHAPRRKLHSPSRSGRVGRQLARRQRRDRLIGVLIALLGVAVLVVAIVALRNPKQHASAAGTDTRLHTPQASAPASHARSTAPSASPSPSGVAGSVPLIVLNQTTTADLGHQAASRFRGGGWQVSFVREAYQNDVITTTAYYDPNTPGAKKAALALQKQYPTIHRVSERFPQLPAGPVVVVLTPDYSSA